MRCMKDVNEFSKELQASAIYMSDMHWSGLTLVLPILKQNLLIASTFLNFLIFSKTTNKFSFEQNEVWTTFANILVYFGKIIIQL